MVLLTQGVFVGDVSYCNHTVDLYLFLCESVCSGFLAYPSLIHLSSIAALTLGLLAGSGSRRDNTNAAAPDAGAGMKQCKVFVFFFISEFGLV